MNKRTYDKAIRMMQKGQYTLSELGIMPKDIIYIKNALWNNNDSSIHFTLSDGNEFNVRIPIPDVFNSIYYDADTKELVIILPNGEEKRINIAELSFNILEVHLLIFR